MAVILNPCEFEDKDFSVTALGGYGPITYALDDDAVAIHATGSGPLSYSIDAVNYVPDTIFTGLTPFVQTVYMRDTAGCDVAHSIIIDKACIEAIYILPT